MYSSNILPELEFATYMQSTIEPETNLGPSPTHLSSTSITAPPTSICHTCPISTGASILECWINGALGLFKISQL